MGFFLALNALNFAEADRPFQRLGQLQVGEMYFALGLQCHNSIPYAATLPMVSFSPHFILGHDLMTSFMKLLHKPH